ncbi:FLYWCH zinc finger domain-containing protein [Phthorimaea operculella]|nr:FLYWCH zinc finger domain-containing protein [Phthorimaea operculella]
MLTINLSVLKQLGQAIFLTSAKGVRYVIIGGFKFTLNKEKRWTNKSLKQRWNCSQRAITGCRARVHTQADRIIAYDNVHNHPPPPPDDMGLPGSTKSKLDEKEWTSVSVGLKFPASLTPVDLFPWTPDTSGTNSNAKTVQTQEPSAATPVIPPYEFVKSRYGNALILMRGYRYSVHKHNVKSDRYKWSCATHRKKGCKATMFSIGDKVIRRADIPHNHAPPPQLPKKLSAVFAKSQRGNPVIMIGQYRFNRVNKHGVRTRWVCVKAKAGCRASLHTIDNAIVRVWGMHDPLAHTTPNRV